MKFVSIRIHNLFSYRDGYFEFPLDSDPTHNVVLIHGRNGFGKTSFINSMKLLFLGLHPELTHNVRPPNKLRPEEYLLGSGAEWEGAFNRHALREKETDCGITVRWQEENGLVTVSRQWSIDHRRNLTETLTVEPEFQVEENELQSTEQKEEFLERRLPKELLPFFIYDAEQVQRIAESNISGTIEHIERLLDITTTRIAEDALGRVLKKLRVDGVARDAQIRLDNLKNQLESRRIQLQQTESEIDQKETDIKEIKYRIQQLDESIQRTRDISRRNEFEQQQVSERLRGSKTELEETSFDFLDSFPIVAPFVAHPGKLQSALERVESLLHSSRSGLARELGDILERLPSRLFDEPQHPRPPLEDAQVRFLKTKLDNLLQAEINLAVASADEKTWQIDNERARRLAQTLKSLLALNGQDTAQNLKKISRLKTEIRQAESTLADVSSLPEDERLRVEAQLAEKDKLEAEADALRETIGGLRKTQPDINAQIEKLRTEVTAQTRAVVNASRNQFGVDMAQNLIEAVRSYRNLLREQRRSDIQTAVNQRFKQLMESHELVHEIRFERDFRFGYFDAQGRSVGMANISAGMKQLVAQALLWGLKDLADQNFPVIIDTPLARIDAAHQRHLITDYYPQAGQQVIVLPTDSELDREKYSLLKPHIAREIRLSNPTGEHTHVDIDSPMFGDK